MFRHSNVSLSYALQEFQKVNDSFHVCMESLEGYHILKSSFHRDFWRTENLLHEQATFMRNLGCAGGGNVPWGAEWMLQLLNDLLKNISQKKIINNKIVKKFIPMPWEYHQRIALCHLEESASSLAFLLNKYRKWEFRKIPSGSNLDRSTKNLSRRRMIPSNISVRIMHTQWYTIYHLQRSVYELCSIHKRYDSSCGRRPDKKYSSMIYVYPVVSKSEVYVRSPYVLSLSSCAVWYVN